jgi:7-cyano-7-deazaguanine synthase in queuosine biosynthesis
MFGIYGIFGSEFKLNPDKKHRAFIQMSEDIDNHDFENQYISRENFSIGITKRKIGDNRDIALKDVCNHDFVMAFCGYGKFKGEKRLFWADEMIDRIASRYLVEGTRLLVRIEGSFIFLAADADNLVIVNDRFASKNLFYYNSDDYFVFAPDVGRIVSSDLTGREKNIHAAVQILSSGFFLDDSTLVKNISRISNATILERSTDNTANPYVRKYWHFPREDGKIDGLNSNLIEEFSYLLEQSIMELADLEENFVVPLSGGLDSRAIACYLSKHYTLHTLTYDTKEEASIAKKVCNALNAEFNYFSNNQLNNKYFVDQINKSISDQKVHAVVNQYFYEPLFRTYFTDNRNKSAIFDGVYLDVLFSGPYVYRSFDYHDFLRTYGGGSAGLIEHYSDLSKDFIHNTLRNVYDELSKEFGPGDEVGRSQFFYSHGRLRRYVLESGNNRLNYSYILSPGFNYDLADFGYGLSLRLRKGLLYKETMYKFFPNVMKIKFKDSYGIRKTNIPEELRRQYINLRLKLSYVTNGLIKYYPFQLEYFFLKENNLDDYRDMLIRRICVPEIFSSNQLKRIFEMVKKKQYMITLFQRVLFIQQFCCRHRLN